MALWCQDDAGTYANYERLEDIFDSLTEIIAEANPDVMSIEKPFFARNKHMTAISVGGGARWRDVDWAKS